MRSQRFYSIVMTVVLVFGALGHAGDVTIDFNGFLNLRGGQVTAAGLDKPLPWAAGAQQVVLKDLQPSVRYNLDFFHNSGEGSSDFSFTMNEAGDGVAAVTPGGGVHDMLVNFKPGDSTLKLRTFDIIYNANAGQTSGYFVSGLIDPHTLPAGSGPRTLHAVPGTFSVDNLNNSGGGNEDYLFMVDDKGQTSGVVDTVRVYSHNPRKELVDRRWVRDGNEYAAYDGAKVNPRFAMVSFTIKGTGRLVVHPTHQAIGMTREGNDVTFDMPMTIGTGGVNISSFGKYTIDKTNIIAPDGKTDEGRTGENDFKFMPRLRYDKDKGLYFDTTDGPANRVHSQATGFYDGNVDALSVNVTAEIIEPRTAATQPAQVE